MLRSKLRAVFYARVSTEEEKQLKALPKQIEECKTTIQAQGWELVDQYVDAVSYTHLYWKNAEVSAYLCQMACAEEELKRELQKIAEYFKIPACFLEAIPVKKDLEDDIFHNNGEKENEESTT